jgi:pimeloyl-ACP methyl ester carboxylesterase
LGYGGSDPRPEGFTSGYFHRDLAQLEQVLERVAPGPMWISGTSDGGSLALMAAAGWPGRVIALAVDGAHYRYEPSMIPAMLDMQRRFGEKHGPPDPGEPEERRTLRLWFAGALAPAAADWTLLPELAAVQCPVSILQGELDGIVDEEHAHGLAAALGGPSRVHILPGGAHLCLRSHPDEWNEWLEESLLHPPTGLAEP